MLEDVNDEIPLFTEREQETVLEGEPIGTKVTQVNAIDKDGTFPNNRVSQFCIAMPLKKFSDLFVYSNFGTNSRRRYTIMWSILRVTREKIISK